MLVCRTEGGGMVSPLGMGRERSSRGHQGHPSPLGYHAPCGVAFPHLLTPHPPLARSPKLPGLSPLPSSSLTPEQVLTPTTSPFRKTSTFHSSVPVRLPERGVSLQHTSTPQCCSHEGSSLWVNPGGTVHPSLANGSTWTFSPVFPRHLPSSSSLVTIGASFAPAGWSLQGCHRAPYSSLSLGLTA